MNISQRNWEVHAHLPNGDFGARYFETEAEALEQAEVYKSKGYLDVVVTYLGEQA